MRFIESELPGVVLIEPEVLRDERGFFFESFHGKRFAQHGLPERFVQDNHSRSVRGTVRGLHAQWRRPQGKLVRALRGAIWDVAVDIRPDSPTFRRWVAFELSSENFRELYVPPGYAHGFCVLTDVAEVEYKVTDYWDPEGELRIRWNDPELAIPWPVSATPILSAKDQDAPLLRDALSFLAAHTGGR
jgi:dTDP-4-dehydrorhamnose 3,5-epimerase